MDLDNIGGGVFDLLIDLKKGKGRGKQLDEAGNEKKQFPISPADSLNVPAPSATVSTITKRDDKTKDKKTKISLADICSNDLVDVNHELEKPNFLVRSEMHSGVDEMVDYAPKKRKLELNKSPNESSSQFVSGLLHVRRKKRAVDSLTSHIVNSGIIGISDEADERILGHTNTGDTNYDEVNAESKGSPILNLDISTGNTNNEIEDGSAIIDSNRHEDLNAVEPSFGTSICAGYIPNTFETDDIVSDSDGIIDKHQPSPIKTKNSKPRTPPTQPKTTKPIEFPPSIFNHFSEMAKKEGLSDTEFARSIIILDDEYINRILTEYC